jgi:lipoprotein-anchoring transpeptidase ErfK/SrfK
MRGSPARYSAAYVGLAGLFGGALLLFGVRANADPTTETSTQLSTETSTVVHSWIERFQLRMNPPPDSIDIAIGPWSVPLRRLDPDEESSDPSFVPPEPPEPREIPPVKTTIPLITRFAEIDPASLEPVYVPPESPDPAPIAQVATATDLNFDADIDRLEAALAPLELAPEPSVTVAGGRSIPVSYITGRLRNRLSSELYADFDLFIYVSKSVDGPLAQHMYVFTKDRDAAKGSELVMLHDWPVSTGRERMETDNHGLPSSTETPVGFYQLDPRRFYRRYTSSQWGRPMPNSMFFDWMVRGYRTGLAIHGVSDPDEVAALGRRASGGCVHLSPQNARALFEMIQDDYKGMVPRFAYNEKTKTISNDGKLARDTKGDVRMVEGYKALVVIENYNGQDILSQLDMDTSRQGG